MCSSDGTRTHVANNRQAQTFRLASAGSLTAAEVAIGGNPDVFSLIFEIRTVDTACEPTAVALASTVMEHIPVTSALTDRPVVANLSPVVPLAAGQAYALTVTGAAGQFALVGNLDDICRDGRLFSDNDLDNDFRPSSADDLAYTLAVI